jgi:hypothetical protein
MLTTAKNQRIDGKVNFVLKGTCSHIVDHNMNLSANLMVRNVRAYALICEKEKLKKINTVTMEYQIPSRGSSSRRRRR